MSFNRLTGKSGYIHTMEYCLAIKRNNRHIDTWYNLDEPEKHYPKTSNTKGHLLYDYFHRLYPE